MSTSGAWCLVTLCRPAELPAAAAAAAAAASQTPRYWAARDRLVGNWHNVTTQPQQQQTPHTTAHWMVSAQGLLLTGLLGTQWSRTDTVLASVEKRTAN